MPYKDEQAQHEFEKRWSPVHYTRYREKNLESVKRWQRANPDKVKTYHHINYLMKCGRVEEANALRTPRMRKPRNLVRMREQQLASQKRIRIKLRAEILEAYGQRCACKHCGESTPEFLAIDHIKGGGGKHIKELRKQGVDFYVWLKRNGFPKDDFRLLCHNCNFARGHYGKCPHESQYLELVCG